MLDIVQKLIGCSWGRSISTPDDTQLCPEMAERIVILHDGPKEIEVRLCSKHVDVVLQETTPHIFQEPIVE